MKTFLLSLFIAFAVTSLAQNVGIGTISPVASAKVEISSTNSGFLIPRMSTMQRDAIGSPATGLQIKPTSELVTMVLSGKTFGNIVNKETGYYD